MRREWKRSGGTRKASPSFWRRPASRSRRKPVTSSSWNGRSPDGVLIRNLGAAQYFRHSPLHRIGDFSLNVANPYSAAILKERGNLDYLTISYDLNAGQVEDLLRAAPPEWFELTLHQHMPMFHMEHCVFCTFLSDGSSYKNCGRPCERYHVQLRDRVGQLHPLLADAGCRNTLFNGRAQTGAGLFPGLPPSGPFPLPRRTAGRFSGKSTPSGIPLPGIAGRLLHCGPAHPGTGRRGTARHHGRHAPAQITQARAWQGERRTKNAPPAP